jgi:hypothetical protein
VSRRRKISTLCLGGATAGLTALTIAAPAEALLPNRHQFWRANSNSNAVSYECMNIDVVHGWTNHHPVSAFARAISRCSGGAGGYAAAITSAGLGRTAVYAASASEAVRTPVSTSATPFCSLYSGPNHAAHLVECVARYG